MKLKLPPRVPPMRWSKSLLELPALSIRQPYAWLVANGIKDIENRSRRTNYRGRILIHASCSRAHLNLEDHKRCEEISGVKLPDPEHFEFGGIIGCVEIVDCVRRHGSPWKYPSQWGWVLTNAQPLKFRECKGFVGFFRPKWMQTPD